MAIKKKFKKTKRTTHRHYTKGRCEHCDERFEREYYVGLQAGKEEYKKDLLNTITDFMNEAG